ncbi:alpha/beta hydrolase [Planomonospora sp. ID91781]|uniref:alpha/beta hydrolase family protein n=1 Tax=Planomonospora sp. ID91781 TaxID=2738135 RepID=UPI0018C39BD0|nr:alpha/beta hydrolase [Planomonospora sp. ID91781]MBG0820847.1 alpha/beta hydrolase [Planomonospora sp. ID91781]
MSRSPLRGALAAAAALLVLATPAAALAAPNQAGAPAAPYPLGAPAAAAPEQAPALALPRPTGPHAVGTTTLHLVDGSRTDPWVSGKPRELMVSIWYPARTARGERAPYMTAKEAELLLKEQGAGAEVVNALAGTRTNAVTGAAPLGRRRGLPLVVLSPGFGMPRSSLTALSEDLASRGYAVVGIDHTHESPTTFPDGRTTPCTTCESGGTPEFGEKSTRVRAADVSFVLDRLTGKRPAWEHAGLIDRSRIGMAGHSLGGNSATHTMLTDPRVRAGVNMDGTFWIPIPGTGLRKPFMLLGAGELHAQGGADPTWGRDWENMTGWKRWVTVKGMGHNALTDYAPLLADVIKDEEMFGTLPGARSLEITRKYVGAFFDLHLRGRSRPLLDRASARYPEVTVNR